MRPTYSPETEKMQSVCIATVNRCFKIWDLTNEYHKIFHIEIVGRNEDGIYEVSEYQAGINENELHIYKETKSLKIALRWFMKGNKQKPIKIWN